MPRNERQERILERVRRHGFVTIEDLAAEFAVTPQTIRRDINYLSRQDLLRRYHGGAGMASTVENVAYQTRQILCHEEKRRIAALLARHIPDGASLFINIGTTTEEVARALTGHENLKIITNNLNVAAMMSPNAGFEVTIAGGVVRSRDGGIIGEATVDFVRQFKVDYGIIGISGIDGDGSLLDFDYREVRVARAIIENARRVCLVVDHTKFGRSAMARLANIGEVDAIYTDRPPPEPICKILADNKVDLYVADTVVDKDGPAAISA
jgi:DeoR family glycerol-3-phosphate regulon repressor